MPARLLALVTAALAALTALGAAPAAGARSGARLAAFDDCRQLVRYGNRNVERSAGRPGPPPPVAMPVPAEGEPGPIASPGGDGAGGGVSPTNVQEAGVDEPDTVKADERTVYALSNGVLRVIDVSEGAPRLIASLRLGDGYGHTMLRRGDRLLVLSQGYGPVAGPAEPSALSSPAFYRPGTRLALVDIADRAQPRLLRTLDSETSLVAARLTGSTARVVLAATPQAMTGAPEARRSRPTAWLPSGTVTNARTERRRTRRLVRCRAVRRTRSFSGLETLTVLTIDLRAGLDPVDADSVMSGAETVYASQGAVYVATQRQDGDLEGRDGGDVPDAIATEIHRFEAVDAGTTRYRGSGRVPGFLLNQFAMSEREGVLRTATTDRPPWFAREDGRPSESFVTTLAVREDRLERLGQVGGLGRGERIYAVRFLGDVGYVVTFRETDPLYAVDVSEPRRPRVRGELKILGYSAYLHPIGPGRLVGVGQDATAEGRRLGTQVSLFDVSDLDAPRVLHRAGVGGSSSSSAEYDHHAFLWWPPTRLAVLPVSVWEETPGPGDTIGARQGFTGAIGFNVSDEGVTEAGRVAHRRAEDAYPGYISRSLVVGDRLYTLSDIGLGANRLDTLAPAGFAAFD